MTTAGPPTDALHEALATVAPGTPLRDGIERIVRAKMGALLILGDGPDVLAICTGGFLLDAPFSPQRLSELAKMDGAIILGSRGQRLARANVHLVPDPSVPTTETGTRHRTAERVARSIPVPVVSVSEEMGVINVYAGGQRHQLQDISRLLDRANQALQTLERYKVRLDDTLASLTALELEGGATIRDVASVVQRGEMVRRISAEIETMIIELGVDARLLRLQVDEVNGEINHELELVLADYPRIANNWAGHGLDGDSPASPRGLRLLTRVPRITPPLANAIVDHFGDLAKLQRATAADIAQIAGHGQLARSRSEGNTRPDHRNEHPRPVRVSRPRQVRRSPNRLSGRRSRLTLGCQTGKYRVPLPLRSAVTVPSSTSLIRWASTLRPAALCSSSRTSAYIVLTIRLDVGTPRAHCGQHLRFALQTMLEERFQERPR